MFLPRLILIVLILAIGAASKAAEPLYQQFRPLGSLPWAKPGATREQVIRRLYREPNQLVRSTLLDEYLKTVPAREFGKVFDLCLRLEEADAPDDLLERLMRAWGRIDPAAAWTKCKSLHEIIVPEDPLGVDSWWTRIVIMNPRAVAASDFWPKSGSFADAFSEGVVESALPPKEKDRYIALQKAKSEAWVAAQEAAEGRTSGESSQSTYQPPPPTPEQLAQQAASQAYQDELTRKDKARRKFVLDILACPPAEVRARLAAAGPDAWDDAVVARALIRWMDGDARRGPEIVEAVLALVDPQGIMRKASTLEPIPIEFLMEWALLDPAGFRAWVLVEKQDEPNGQKEARPGLKAKTVAVLQAIAFRDDGDWMLGGVSENFDHRNNDDKDVQKSNEAALYWATIDPAHALPWIWSRGGLRMYGEAAESAVYAREGRRGANVARAVFAALDDYAVPIPDDPLFMLMEEWSSIDAAACARHGTRWCLRTRHFTKQRMIREYTGYEDPYDGAVDDRHFGSLRIWAMRKPEQMRKWIRTEPLDEDVRKALLWLVDHAKGGFELRKNGLPPAPIKP